MGGQSDGSGMTVIVEERNGRDKKPRRPCGRRGECLKECHLIHFLACTICVGGFSLFLLLVTVTTA